ncbi:uncharacterized protein PV06_10925 [Exophiala oligosperma]|uniref:Zn(2)-C6 fungal-type domain-containing protein n=1 Tax=Exophiala oligosperma TaxID=215243 RepID=A0A0D2D0I6_9EURO|nr:uncharacterized protein PV06_10925 [Exophiala oligosperma]KIW36803.1 hypothetical protein PV06_10925 [Exophiala oligosperma]
MSEQRASKEKPDRKYTSLACDLCRRKRIKCSSGRPCSNCKLYSSECVYGLDKRRMSENVRRKGSVLSDNIKDEAPSEHSVNGNEDLEATPVTTYDGQLQWHDLNLPSFVGNDGRPADFLETQGDWDLATTAFDTIEPASFFSDALSGHDNGSHPTHPYVGGSFTQHAANLHWPSENHNDLISDIASFKVPGGTPETSFGSVNTSPAAINVGAEQESKRRLGKTRSADDAATVNDVTRQLTSRLGRLQITEGGQARYYGAMSNLHLLHTGPASLVQPNIRNVVSHGEAAIIQAGLQWTSDPAYESHLINLVFCWHNALMYVLDRDIFFKERKRFLAGESTDLYSPALENAVFAVGAAYTDRTHPAVNDATDEFFAFRSKTYLEIEVDSPTIATAQALLILSSHEAAHARESRGWIYSGMAVQIMTDLGLHLDLGEEYSRLESRVNIDSEDMLILRRNLFWSINTIDTLWSTHCGRPSLMKSLRHNVQDPLPSRTYQWEYYVDPYTSMRFPAKFDFAAAAHVHVYLASLMKILAQVSDVLYSGVPDVSDDMRSFVAQADQDFRDWFSSLPANLHLDVTGSSPFQIPAILELHLSYYECIILLHRPFIAPDDTLLSTGESPLSKCVQSAEEICNILVLFRKMYGLRRPHHHMCHITMTAALIHIFRLCVAIEEQSERDNAQRHFLTCVQALAEMSQTYKSASRGLDVVTSLRQSWQNDPFAGDRFKRARIG